MSGGSYVRHGRPGHVCTPPQQNDPPSTLWRCDCGVLWYAGVGCWMRARWARPWLVWKYRRAALAEVNETQ